MPRQDRRLSAYARRLVPSAIRGLAEIPCAEDTIALGPGQPDPTLFPTSEIAASLARILAEPRRAQKALQYGPTEGDPRLREMVAAYMASKGVRCGPEHVLLTNGSQQALHLMTALLVEDGDTVGVQTPTYPGALQIFIAHGARIRDLADFERDVTARPSMIYAMSNFQNPTGATLSLHERRALVALARTRGSIVVEDDPYEILRYEGESLPPLLALEDCAIDDAHAVYLGTFSKSIAPGFRVGWVVGPRDIVAELALMKQTEDLQAGTLAQACLADVFMPALNGHAEALREAYRRRRDAMLAALASAHGNLATWRVPAGGFFLWLRLPDGFDSAAMLPRAAQNGVTYIPGSAFFHDGSGGHFLRLSYSATPEARIAEGVERLFRTIRALS